MLKLLEAVELGMEELKKATVLPSGSAETVIVTPLAGIADVIVTLRLKGPGAGACVEPVAGVVVTVNVASGVLFFEEQARVKQRITPPSIAKNGFFIMSRYLTGIKIKQKRLLFFKDLDIAAKALVQRDKGFRTLDPLYFLQLVVKYETELINVLTSYFREHAIIPGRIIEPDDLRDLLQFFGHTII
jgi:hypothetical protein